MMLAGKFELVRELGRGAFGVVYEARDAVLERTVAIKTIRDDVFASPETRESFEKRFLREARSAAALHHPNIITVFEAGRDGSSSYIAMEYVRGRSLRDLLRSRGRLSVSEMVQVAEPLLLAIGAAHTQGIVHRDIKPENVMIREDGVLKVADFGIAKPLGKDTASLTQEGSVLGTPAYMAPEQVTGKSVDGRTDLYAVAALLYECLATSRPFEADTIPSLVHRVLFSPPTPMDPALGVPPAVEQVLAGCLAKELADRPPDAATMLRELRTAAAIAAPSADDRHATVAAPPSTRLAPAPPPRRSAPTPTIASMRATVVPAAAAPSSGRGWFAAVVLLVLLLVAGIVAAGTFGYFRYEKGRREEAWRARSQAADTAFRRSDFAAAVREGEEAVRISQAFGDADPRYWRSMLDLARAFESSGELPKAETLQKRALATREKVLGPEHPDVAASLDGVANVLAAQGKHADAEPYHRRALGLRERLLGADHLEVASSLMGLAWALFNQGKGADAELLYRRALLVREKRLGNDHLDVAWSLDGLAWSLFAQNKYEEAEASFRRCLAIRSRHLGPGSVDLGRAHHGLGTTLSYEKKLPDAEAHLKEALAIRQRALGPDHLDVAWSAYELATVCFSSERFEDAARYLRQAIAVREKVLGADADEVGLAVHDLAAAMGNLKRPKDAEPLYRRALAIFEKRRAADDAMTALCLHNMGLLYNDAQRWSEAETCLRRAFTMRDKLFGRKSDLVVQTAQAYAVTLRAVGRGPAADKLLADIGAPP